MRALQIAATGMSAQQMRVEVISNNLANMSTTGYNPRRAEFADLQYQQATRPGTLTATNGAMVPAGVQLGLGVRPAAVTVMLGQGTLSQTNGDLDGHRRARLSGGDAAFRRLGLYPRRQPEAFGRGAGRHLGRLSAGPRYHHPPGRAQHRHQRHGEVFAYFNDRVEPENLGQITLANFVNEKGLEAIGSNLFLETTASGAPQVASPGEEGLGTIRAGYLEESHRPGARGRRTDQGAARL